MNLHPQAQAVIDTLAAMKLPSPDTIPVALAREQFMRARASFLPAPEEVASCIDRTLPGPAGAIPVRIYRPRGSNAEAKLPALFHTGQTGIGAGIGSVIVSRGALTIRSATSIPRVTRPKALYCRSRKVESPTHTKNCDPALFGSWARAIETIPRLWDVSLNSALIV